MNHALNVCKQTEKCNIYTVVSRTDPKFVDMLFMKNSENVYKSSKMLFFQL